MREELDKILEPIIKRSIELIERDNKDEIAGRTLSLYSKTLSEDDEVLLEIVIISIITKMKKKGK